MKDFKTRGEMRREHEAWKRKVDNVMYSILFVMCSGVFAWALFGFLTY